MKHLFFLFFYILEISCTQDRRTLNFKPNEIDHIEVYKGFPRDKVEMSVDFENELIADLNKSKPLGLTKHAKTHIFIIFYKNRN